MFVSGKPRAWLKLDGLVLFIASIIIFATTNQRWWLYPVIVFVPDIFMIGYFANKKMGAYLYNLGHSYLAPSLLILLAWNMDSKATFAIGIIWLGHIGFDHIWGYGLKYDSSFKDTHLGNFA